MERSLPFSNTPTVRTDFPHEYSKSCDDPEAMSIFARAAVQTTQAYPLHINAERGLQCLPQSTAVCRSALGPRWEIPDLLVSARKCKYGWVGTDLLPLNFQPSVQRFNRRGAAIKALRKCVVDSLCSEQAFKHP